MIRHAWFDEEYDVTPLMEGVIIMSTLNDKREKIIRAFHRLGSSYKDRRFADCFKEYRLCSKYGEKNKPKYMVGISMQAIDFDMLTKWLCEKNVNVPQSADSLSFSKDAFVYLIEFKSGDQIGRERNRTRLINNVSGKIKDSADTIYKYILNGREDKEIALRFRLVVDSKAMGSDAQALALAELSNSTTVPFNARINELLKDTISILNGGPSFSQCYDNIDIWYNELFPLHLKSEKMVDVEQYLNG